MKKTRAVGVSFLAGIGVILAGAVVFSICAYLYAYCRDIYQVAGKFIIREEPRIKNTNSRGNKACFNMAQTFL